MNLVWSRSTTMVVPPPFAADPRGEPQQPGMEIDHVKTEPLQARPPSDATFSKSLALKPQPLLRGNPLVAATAAEIVPGNVADLGDNEVLGHEA